MATKKPALKKTAAKAPKKAAAPTKAAAPKKTASKAPKQTRAKEAARAKVEPAPSATTGAFAGFPRGGGAFFEELAAHQSREWFQANKARYERLWLQPITALADAVAERLEADFPGASSTRRKVFRIHRDVRFSADKSPYKTHAGAVVFLTPTAGKETASFVCYMHFEASSQFVGVGWYELPPVELERFRKAVAGPAGEALARELAKLEQKRYRVGARESLKRVPPGFPQDHPRGELLKKKGFILELPPLPASTVGKPELVDWIVAHVRAARPVLDWMREHVG